MANVILFAFGKGDFVDEGGSKTLILYHGQCSDGFTAAWVARKKYPDAKFIPVIHGQEPPDVTGKDVLILDFSYKRSQLLQMKEKSNSLLILDHHKTAALELEGLPFCVFDMEKSGASLTWDYYYGGKMPWIVSYAEDRDLWKYSLPFSKEINAALESYPFDFSIWDSLEKNYQEITNSPLVEEGRSIIRYQERLIDVIIQHARPVNLDGYVIKAANTSCIFSQVANKLAQDQPFGLAWYLREDGKYVHSLRSMDWGADVSQIAKNHGGGGHMHSAGFETKEMILKEA